MLHRAARFSIQHPSPGPGDGLRTFARRVSVLFVAMLIGCGGEETAPAGDAAAERAAIREISDGWLQNTRERRADVIADYFAPHAVVLKSGQAPIVGPEAIRADIERDWSINPDFTIDWESSSLTVAESGDLAWERGSWTFDPDGSAPAPEASGAFVTVYAKVDGEWKVVADIGVPTGEGDSRQEKM